MTELHVTAPKKDLTLTKLYSIKGLQAKLKLYYLLKQAYFDLIEQFQDLDILIISFKKRNFPIFT